MSAPTFPPFPDDIPIIPLLVIDYKLIKARNQAEIDRLWEAATKLGFWHLINHGIDDEVVGMLDMGAETMKLPMEEKIKFEQGDAGLSFGYIARGANAVDPTGKDSIEYINIAKDDALAWPKQARREYPSTVKARMEPTIGPFIRKSLEVNNTLLDVFNDRLGLAPGTLMKGHLTEEYSGSEVRVTKIPSCPPANGLVLGNHTDFGTMSFVHNRHGGLQLLIPGEETWKHVKPIPGHATCNVGDTLSVASGGILRSNIHRVLPPPGDQPDLDRWGVTYFSRPGNSVVLRALTDESPQIAEAAARTAEKHPFTGSTTQECFEKRIKSQRVNNRKGLEMWMASRGIESLRA